MGFFKSIGTKLNKTTKGIKSGVDKTTKGIKSNINRTTKGIKASIDNTGKSIMKADKAVEEGLAPARSRKKRKNMRR